MNDLQIHLPHNDGFDPGSEVAIRVNWNVDYDPESIELRLVWNTSGKGDTDLKVVKSVKLQTQARQGDDEVVITLPWGPYSFSGKLISLIWAFELVVLPEEDSIREEFVMARHGREVVLKTSTTDV